MRDYFHVKDAAAAYLLLAESLGDRPELIGEAFNFSNEVQVSALDLVRRILRLMESDLEPDVRDGASHEIPHQYLSAAKARRVLGWHPLLSLESGLLETIHWYREQLSSPLRSALPPGEG